MQLKYWNVTPKNTVASPLVLIIFHFYGLLYTVRIFIAMNCHPNKPRSSLVSSSETQGQTVELRKVRTGKKKWAKKSQGQNGGLPTLPLTLPRPLFLPVPTFPHPTFCFWISEDALCSCSWIGRVSAIQIQGGGFKSHQGQRVFLNILWSTFHLGRNAQ